MKKFLIAASVIFLAASVPAMTAQDATFERTLNFTGQATLDVYTVSGHIHLTRGTDSQIHIVATVKSMGKNVKENRAHDVTLHPPIDQTGTIIQVGAHSDSLRGLSIDYEIQAPANTYISATSGEGDVKDEGVGSSTRLNTNVGSIHASGLHGNFVLSAVTGDIYADQVGTGDVRASTGHGVIELRNVSGGLTAESGGGDIKVGGAPTSPWLLKTGAGNIELWPGSAALSLEAMMGQGEIRTEREMVVKGTQNTHQFSGKLNGGGPLVHAESVSGDIRIH